MFRFGRKSGVASPSAAILRALKSDGWPPGVDTASALGVVESRGAYSGRKVTYFRVFDPARVAARGVSVRAYADLDPHRDLVLRSGHIEKDGTVVIAHREPGADAPTPDRERADRAMHGDDEQFVFSGEGR
jgi:hypothetical protein